MNKCIFFDRDGVLIEDIHLLTQLKQVKFYLETFEAIRLILHSDYKSIVITNQPVVARGMISEQKVESINNFIKDQIFNKTKYKIEKFYYCPHHPNANIENYRINCNCRKPKSGMLLQATDEYDIDLNNSWMIGDRISDIIAGHNVGCKTILVETGKHLDKPIESDIIDFSIKPDFICNNILEAVRIILNY
jgi:D-glycero-D-manno-heptose 1,7-bisphosphate phosphatase